MITCHELIEGKGLRKVRYRKEGVNREKIARKEKKGYENFS